MKARVGVLLRGSPSHPGVWEINSPSNISCFFKIKNVCSSLGIEGLTVMAVSPPINGELDKADQRFATGKWCLPEDFAVLSKLCAYRLKVRKIRSGHKPH